MTEEIQKLLIESRPDVMAEEKYSFQPCEALWTITSMGRATPAERKLRGETARKLIESGEVKLPPTAPR